MSRYVDAIFRGGKIELLGPVSLAEGAKVKVLIEGTDDREDQHALVTRLRGAFKGSLSSTEEFCRRKAEEKVVER